MPMNRRAFLAASAAALPALTVRADADARRSLGMVVQGPPDFPLAISVAYPVNQHIEGGQPRLIELLSTTAVKIRQKLSTTS